MQGNGVVYLTVFVPPCFKYNSHSYLTKSLRWRLSSFYLEWWKKFHYLARKASFISTYVAFDVVGFSWVSHWDKPYDGFHMVVDLYEVLNPCLARCWDNEVVLLTNQKGYMWVSHCWKHTVSLRAYNSMGSSPNLHLHALLKDFPMRVFQVTSQNSVLNVNVGIIESLE